MSACTSTRVLSLGFAAAAAMLAVPAAAALPADFKTKADAYVEAAWAADAPGAAVVVVDDGKIVYQRGRGLADVEGGRPIAPDTVFRIGSITKQFAAAVILQLVDEGKLSLDDPLSKFLPDYPKPGADATVRQLLNHTSGIQSYTSIPGWISEANTNRPYTTAEMIAVFKDLPAVSPPGQAWAYNNSGYVLVGAIIEKVTGKPWHEAVRERIAIPLGMDTLRYGVEEATLPNMAKGYTSSESGPVLAQKIHLSVPHAAGGLIASVQDLAKWAQALHHGKAVSATSYARMIAPTKMPDGTDTGYGFGISNSQLRGRAAIGHGGGIFGFMTDSIYVPEEDLFVAVFANSIPISTQADVATKRLAALALGDPFPDFVEVKVDPESLKPLAGVYRKDSGDRSGGKVLIRDNMIYVQPDAYPEARLIPAGGDRFFVGPQSLIWMQFHRDPAGAHAVEVHYPDKPSERSVRTGPLPPEAPAVEVPRARLESYVGRYKAEQFVMVIFFDGEGKLTARMEGRGEGRMRALSQTEFSVEGAPIRLLFEESDGRVNRLTVRNGAQDIAATRTEPGA